jgi:hypothetical protein
MPYFPIFLRFNGFQYAHEDQKVTYDASLLLDDLKNGDDSLPVFRGGTWNR